MSILRSEEIVDDLHELVMFLPHGCVARTFKCQPLYFGDPVEKRLDHKVLRDVMPPVQQKSGDVDLVQAFDDVPIFKRSRRPVAPKVRNTKYWIPSHETHM